MAEGNFPNAKEYLGQWCRVLVETLRKSAIDEMNENKSKAKFPSDGDVAGSPLVAGMRFSSVIFGKHIEFQIIMPQGWNWLETGRAAGKMPPEEPIVRWVAQRGFPLDISKRRKSLLKKLGSKTIKKGLKQLSKEARAKQIAFGIRRKIGRDGTRATHFYSNVVTDKLKEDLITVMKERFNKDIRIELLTLAQ